MCPHIAICGHICFCEQKRKIFEQQKSAAKEKKHLKLQYIYIAYIFTFWQIETHCDYYLCASSLRFRNRLCQRALAATTFQEIWSDRPHLSHVFNTAPRPANAVRSCGEVSGRRCEVVLYFLFVRIWYITLLAGLSTVHLLPPHQLR